MQTLVPYQGRDLDPTTRSELEELVGRKMIGPARSIGYDLEPLGIVTAPVTEPEWWRKPDGDWALAAPRALDPVALQHGGQMPAPPAVCERIDAMAGAGFDCDHVIVMHEYPTGFTPGDPEPSLVPATREPRLPDKTTTALSQAALDLTAAAVRGVGKASVGIAGAGVAPAAAPAALGAGLAQLDPICSAASSILGSRR